MKRIEVFVIVLLLGMFFSGINAQTLSGRDIIQKAKDRPDGDTRYMEMTMELINKRGRKRERTVRSFSIDIGKDKKTIMFFLYPGDVKDTGFLTWDYDELGKDDDKWLYLPAMKKTRRISGASAKKEYFMGTDFTFDDMGNRNIDEDDHVFLREETLAGNKCWVVESNSKDSRDIYSKKITWIRQDCLIATKIEYYDKLGKLNRELKVSDIEKVQGFWLAHKMHMRNVQTEHQTILSFVNPKFNVDVDENIFTVTKLEQGIL